MLAEYYDPKTLELLNNYYDEDFRFASSIRVHYDCVCASNLTLFSSLWSCPCRRFKFHKFSHAELVKGDISSFREE